MTEARRIAAEARYAKAQQDEAAAREAHSPRGVDAAKAEQEAAMDEIYKLQEETRTGAGGDEVTLIGPNPFANVTDSNDVTFVDRKARVRRSLARKYVEDLDGYTIEEESK